MKNLLFFTLLMFILIQPLLSAEAESEEVLNLRGMTVIGNQELPKSLIVVPWKQSELGELLEHSMDSLLDSGMQPLDREVFERKLDYYRVGAGLPLRPE